MSLFSLQNLSILLFQIFFRFFLSLSIVRFPVPLSGSVLCLHFLSIPLFHIFISLFCLHLLFSIYCLFLYFYIHFLSLPRLLFYISCLFLISYSPSPVSSSSPILHFLSLPSRLFSISCLFLISYSFDSLPRTPNWGHWLIYFRKTKLN